MARAISRPETAGIWMSRNTASTDSVVRALRAADPEVARWMTPMRSSRPKR
jgi:hypothetical protein